MSLRRKSCDACYHGRRKCDRDYPICGTCRRTKKTCHFAYSPTAAVSRSGDLTISTPVDTTDTDIRGDTQSLTEIGNSANVILPAPDNDFVFFDPLGGDQCASLLPVNRQSSNNATSPNNFFANWQYVPTSTSSPPSAPTVTLPLFSIPDYLGGLGELQRVEGSTESWQWVIDQLKRCPSDLATRGETLFLHRDLYRDSMPAAIRAALGVSAMFALLNDDNRRTLFRVVDAEVSELLKKAPSQRDSCNGDGVGSDSDNGNRSQGLTLIEELARLQAFLLYQMMRLFGGGLEQRVVVEQQHFLMTTWALQLLKRSQAGDNIHENKVESRRSSSTGYDDEWHAWLVSESIRRTVMAVYVFYGMYSLAMHGFCADFPILAKLPVSASLELWQSKATDLPQWHPSVGKEAAKTLAYDEYTQCWAVSPPKKMIPFEKFLIIPCKGFEVIAAYGCSVD
ncbi:hypothetical protein PG985_007631 [Apiospora marii]|uniref:uncharacterized protein n=1 Tax=Apiospora marii TaxID=335849 RepID=UPI00312E0239